MQRYVFKVSEVMSLLKTGNKATLVVCTYDEKRIGRNGRRIELKNVVYSSNKGFLSCNVRLPNGELQEFHPCLIESFNGTRVTP